MAQKKKQVLKVGKGKGKTKFDGKKHIDGEGLVALNRKFTDAKAWAARRKKERAPPGGWPKPPSHWPPGIRVDIRRPVYWLPEGWGQGVKTTCASRLGCYVSPEGKVYYHRHVVEAIQGEKLGRPDNPEKALKWAKDWAVKQIKIGESWDRKILDFKKPDEDMFKHLSKSERKFLPASASEFHFAVISARRADNEKGLRSITNVESQLRAGGAKATWYVDAPSLKLYQQLGLNAKVGGKLVEARNMALEDAKRMKKPCVQVSDDISSWDYLCGELTRVMGLAAGNEAAKSADKLRISPVGAARFLLAKLRAARSGGDGPHLAGVFPLGNTGMAMNKDAISTDNFILGDFFVAEPGSPCRFDPRLTLKEDYDYTCSHLDRHKSVLRCNRLFAAAAHQTNEGGAVSERDSKGAKERANIEILQEKWPGVFRLHGRRGDTEVVMNWKWRKSVGEAKPSPDTKGSKSAQIAINAKKKQSKRVASKVMGVKRTIRKT